MGHFFLARPVVTLFKGYTNCLCFDYEVPAMLLQDMKLRNRYSQNNDRFYRNIDLLWIRPLGLDHHASMCLYWLNLSYFVLFQPKTASFHVNLNAIQLKRCIVS